MRRDEFAAGQLVGRFLDEKSGFTLYPYSDVKVKEWTIWKCINPKLSSGMLMVRTLMTDEFSNVPRWSVSWRSDDGQEQAGFFLTAQDITDNFKPVFNVLK